MSINSELCSVATNNKVIMSTCFSFVAGTPCKSKDLKCVPRLTITSMRVNDFVYRLARDLDAAWETDKLFEYSLQYRLRQNVFFFFNIKSKLLNYEPLAIRHSSAASSADAAVDEELGLTIGVTYANLEAKKDEEMMVKVQLVTMKKNSTKVFVKDSLEITASVIENKNYDPAFTLETLKWIHDKFLAFDKHYEEVFKYASLMVLEKEKELKEKTFVETVEFYKSKKRKASEALLEQASKVQMESSPKSTNSI